MMSGRSTLAARDGVVGEAIGAGRPVQVGQIAEAASSGAADADTLVRLMTALSEVASRGHWNAKSVGWWLTSNKDRVRDGWVFRAGEGNGCRTWRLEDQRAGQRPTREVQHDLPLGASPAGPAPDFCRGCGAGAMSGPRGMASLRVSRVSLGLERNGLGGTYCRGGRAVANPRNRETRHAAPPGADDGRMSGAAHTGRTYGRQRPEPRRGGFWNLRTAVEPRKDWR